jgi:hypothetical protein
MDEANYGLDRWHCCTNKFVSGTGLPFDSAKVITTKNSKPIVTNGPFGDIKETIGGFIVVKAGSVEEAVEFAKGCPCCKAKAIVWK